MASNIKIPFGNLDRQFASHRETFLKIADEVFTSGNLLQSRAIDDFENKMAEMCGRKRAVAVNSCTDALYFALLTCGVKPGDEVLVTSFSFIASLSPILRAGAKPVFIDIEPDYFMMDLKSIERKITPNTKFILAVHLFGQCLNMREVEEFAKKHNITIIEDAAQSFGSSYKGRPAGKLGKVSCISFDPTKVVGSFGSAGIALTDSEEIAEHIKRLRCHGKGKGENGFSHLGFNSQLSSEHAAMLSFKLDLLKEWMAKRNQIAQKYIAELKDFEGENLTLPKIRKDSSHNWHKFVLKTKHRDKLRKKLSEMGIDTKVHYTYTLGRTEYLPENFKDSARIAEKITKEVLSLPIYPELTDEEIKHIIKELKEFFKYE